MHLIRCLVARCLLWYAIVVSLCPFRHCLLLRAASFRQAVEKNTIGLYYNSFDKNAVIHGRKCSIHKQVC